jgi:hypothetical protein
MPPSLQKADDRFMHRFQVIEGGSGYFYGIIDEPRQGAVPVYQFVTDRRLLRVNPGVPISSGMIIKTPNESVFIVAKHGDAEEIFDSFRLVEPTGQYLWQKRGKTVDPVTNLPRDTGLVSQGQMWGSYEPAATEMFDRQIRSSFETGRFVTNRPVAVDDIVDGKRVARSDLQLGLYVLTLG